MPGSRCGAEATYLAWMTAAERHRRHPQKFFWSAPRGLQTARGSARAPGFVRLNFGCPRATLTQALERMRDAMRT